MPTPNKGENRKDYIKRCVPYVIDEGTAANPKQAVAVCHSLWKQHRNKRTSRASELIDEVAKNLKG